jgi:diaminopimelate epimerase
MLPFIKMHANGNDFMIIDSWHNTIPLPNASTIAKWADRQTGIGFDQLLYFTKPYDLNADIHCLIFNADGSESGQCGHGMACIAQLVYKQAYLHKMQFYIATKAGTWSVAILDEYEVKVDLGCPSFNPKEIPFNVSKLSPLYQLKFESKNMHDAAAMQVLQTYQQNIFAPFFKDMDTVSSVAPHVHFRVVANILSLGNPHCVIWVPHLDKVPAALGEILSKHPQFPLHTNVEFIQIIRPDFIRLRVYERGVGENRACGSGACAAVVAGRLLNYLSEAVTVQFPKGDTVQVIWPHTTASVQLRTTVNYIFKGELLI